MIHSGRGLKWECTGRERTVALAQMEHAMKDNPVFGSFGRFQETPKAEMTLYNTPSELFTPAVVTAENLKAEIIDKNIVPAATLCVDRYVDGCKKLGITP